MAATEKLEDRAPTHARAREKPFVALDGESVDVAGEHRYVCLTSSSGNSVVDPAGVSTRDALAFLIREGRRHDDVAPILVGFFFNYDVNMLLRDVPREQLEQLWNDGETTFEQPDGVFRLRWIPTKLFDVTAELDTPAGPLRANITLYDAFGFFQSSFVKACQAWGLGDRLQLIEQMKARRGEFRLDELDELVRYSTEECRLLVELMDQVRAALRDVGLQLRSWLGAGAIAQALLSKHRVQEHLHRRNTIRPAVDEAIMRAYFGGRTEVFQQGIQPFAESWDVNSAYPWAATFLESARGRWRRVREYEPTATTAIWRTQWRVSSDALLAPFPFRHKRAIFWPNDGDGYYHAAEVAAAIALYGDAICVTSGYVFEPATDEQPFAFLADVYAQRAELKQQNHPGEKVLKLGINSVYGKLAQGAARDGYLPKFQCYQWAGMITAITRAHILDACALAPERVVAVATDGIVFAPQGPVELEAAGGLGGWERTRYRDFFVAQPGMYHATDRTSNRRIRHSRGFFTRELNFTALRRLWLERGPIASWASKSTRFMGLGASLLRTDFSVWRTWQEGERRVSLYLEPRKRYADEEPELVKQLWPPDRVRGGISDPYVPKYAAVELDAEQADWIEGNEQPDAG